MVMLVSYLIGGIILTTSCCFCCLTLAVVGREVEGWNAARCVWWRRPGTEMLGYVRRSKGKTDLSFANTSG